MEKPDEMEDVEAVCDTVSHDFGLTGDQLGSKTGLICPHRSSADHPVEVHMSSVSLKKSDVSHPSLSRNGIAVHKDKGHLHNNVDIVECGDKMSESSKLSHLNTIDLSDTQIHEKSHKRDDYVDSGVHSGTENGSDAKSSSSSPILSTESSVHDLCEKSEKTYTLDESSNDNRSDVDKLTDDVSKTLSLSPVDSTSDVIQKDVEEGIEYVVYESELQMPDIMKLITKDLSEPYSIYTYRYFIHNWPKLCFLAMDKSLCVGAIVCKLDMHKKMVRRGYIAMLAVDQSCRRKGIGSHLVLKAIGAMIADDCDEVVLETEITNKAALRLYENLGFVRDKRLFRYYLNGVDALRLKLWLR